MMRTTALKSLQVNAATWAALVVTLLMTGCGGSLYKVKPAIDAPVSEKAGAIAAGGVHLRAVPLLTDEESQELFESNLPLAGLLPVRVELVNNSSAPVDLKHARFRLHDSEGREWKWRTPKEAVSRILDFNEVTLYNPNSRKQFEKDFRAHALQTDTPLAAGQQRQGLIFFQTPKKEKLEGPRGLVLTIEKIPQPLEVRLN